MFVSVPSRNLEFKRHMSWFCMSCELLWEVFVRFVDIGGNDDHHYLNFPFINFHNYFTYVKAYYSFKWTFSGHGKFSEGMLIDFRDKSLTYVNSVNLSCIIRFATHNVRILYFAVKKLWNSGDLFRQKFKSKYQFCNLKSN